ncbi:MAG TPA: globin domain-containing protein [Flavisolibacter sp.]|jgi:hemoglobin-like flavoprotein|nr:globin domain-containing protein [Flavisolibacter sp.]
MTKEEISLVKQSWKMVRDVPPQVIGDVFYTKLFLDAPGLRSLFTHSIGNQSEKLVGMLNVIVARLEHMDLLKKDVQALALRHQSYGVKTAHYDMVGNALLWTLEKAFGPEWNEPLAQAWLKCYTSLATVMLLATEGPSVV